MRDAAELGDITALYDIAAVIKSRLAAYAPLGNRLLQMAENIDSDGVLNLADELDRSSNA